MISSVEDDEDKIGPFVFGTDGSGAENLIVPAGGLRKPCTLETRIEKEVGKGISRSEQNLFMNGNEVFNFTLRVVPQSVSELLAKSQLSINDVDFFVYHQANKFMLDHLRRKLKIPKEKFCINLDTYGNTVSSTIPMALERAIQHGQIKNGDNVMLVGFGVGYSWAATLVKLLIGE